MAPKHRAQQVVKALDTSALTRGAHNLQAVRHGFIRSIIPKYVVRAFALSAGLFGIASIALHKHLLTHDNPPNFDRLWPAKKFAGKRIAATQQQNGIRERTQRSVHFINHTQLHAWDAFSASWFQHRTQFLEMNISRIPSCEAAAFDAWNRDWSLLRMPVDLLDFAVEHHSFYWKLLADSDAAHDVVNSHFQRYIGQGVNYPTPSNPILKNTLALIAFRPYVKKASIVTARDQRSFYKRTILSLASAVEALRRAEMGRAVVVGMNESDKMYVDAAFRYLASQLPAIQSDDKKIGQLELGFAIADPAKSWSKQAERNLPKGALAGVRDAIISENNSNADFTAWLGSVHDASYWQYFHLTEPDQILITRPSSLSHIKMQADMGHVVAPHRLQPIWHEHDLNISVARKFLKASNGFGNISQLNTLTDNCCDELAGPLIRPGKIKPDCGGRWFACGLERDLAQHEPDPLQRLRPYQLIRLRQTTGLTLLAATVQGRRCKPAFASSCDAS